MIREYIPFPAFLSLVARKKGFHTKTKKNTCDRDNFRKHLQITNTYSGEKKKTLRIHKYS